MRFVNPTFNGYIARLSPVQLFELCERCHSTIEYFEIHLGRGNRQPSLKLAQRIAFHTDGAVPLTSWPLPAELMVRQPKAVKRAPAAAVLEPLEVEHAAG